LPVSRAYFAAAAVDNTGIGSLYRPSWARRRLARWRVCEAPHCFTRWLSIRPCSLWPCSRRRVGCGGLYGLRSVFSGLCRRRVGTTELQGSGLFDKW